MKIINVKDYLNNLLIFLVDFVVQEFYVAPAATEKDENVDDSVYASSGKYIDQVNIFYNYLNYKIYLMV